jgi:hypothetical protein
MRSVTVSILNGRPVSFTYEHRQLQVLEISDHWSEQGRWWDGDVPCDLYLAGTGSGLFLLCLDTRQKVWYAKPVQ